MSDAPLSPRDADEALAAEYVLGVLDPAERAQAESRIKRETAFAILVQDWENRLAGLNEGFAEAAAPDLLPKIEARLFPKAQRTAAQGGRLSDLVGWLSGAMVAAVLVLAIVAFVAPPRAMLIATLATADNRLAYQVVQLGTALKVSRVSGDAAAAGLVHQLWLIPPGEGPISLGLLEDGPLIIDQEVPPAGWSFAVSLEPAGGSNMGVPTGPVILKAEIGT